MRPQTTLLAAAAAAAAWLLYKKKKKRRVVITGCCGNLGRKLGAYLQEQGVEVVGIEHPDYCAKGSPPPCHAVVQGDAQRASDASDRPWRAVLRGADAVVHFSAVNPYPNADWAESSGSMDHAFNVALAAADAGVPRFILASSNHVMGGYKDDHKHGVVKPSDAPRVGTALNDPAAAQRAGDAVAYAAAKLAAERLLAALAHVRPRTVFLALRVGWCQPGINSPRTIGASGVPPAFETAGAAASVEDDSHDDAWFRGMWLSNQDFLLLFGAAALSDSVPRSGYHCVNAMSANTNARWSLDETEALLGVRPRDDARAAQRAADDNDERALQDDLVAAVTSKDVDDRAAAAAIDAAFGGGGAERQAGLARLAADLRAEVRDKLDPAVEAERQRRAAARE